MLTMNNGIIEGDAMSLELQDYREKSTGDIFHFVGFADYIGPDGKTGGPVAICHPDTEPNLLYAISMDVFNELFERWKAEVRP